MVKYPNQSKYQKVKDLVDLRYSHHPKQMISLYRDPLDDTFYTRSIRLLQNKEKSENLTSLLQRRIDNPNLYYVSPADFNMKAHK